MPTALYSFGFRHGLTVNGKMVFPADPSSVRPGVQTVGGALILDVRRILPKNPYHNRALRKLRGDDEAVIRELEQTPKLEEKYQDILALVRAFSGAVYVGCTGGHHRSVYVANRLATDLRMPATHLNYSDK